MPIMLNLDTVAYRTILYPGSTREPHRRADNRQVPFGEQGLQVWYSDRTVISFNVLSYEIAYVRISCDAFLSALFIASCGQPDCRPNYRKIVGYQVKVVLTVFTYWSLLYAFD